MSQNPSQPSEGFPPPHPFAFEPQLNLPPDIRNRTPVFQQSSLARQSFPDGYTHIQEQDRGLYGPAQANTSEHDQRSSYQVPPSPVPSVGGEDGGQQPPNAYYVPVSNTSNTSGASSRSGSLNPSTSGSTAPSHPPSARQSLAGATSSRDVHPDTVHIQTLKGYADWVVGVLGLQPKQLTDMHRYVQFGANLDLGHTCMHIWTLGRIFQTMNVLEGLQAKTERVDKLVQMLIERLEKDFKLTQDQINYIIKICKDCVFGYNVSNYRTAGSMVGEVEEKLKGHELFSKIYASDDNVVEQKAVTEGVKDKLGNARTDLRSEVIDSICQRMNLQTLTYNLAKKLKKGGVSGSSKISYKYQIQVALIRRFTWDEMRFSVFNIPPNNDWDAPLTRKKQGSGKTAQGEDFFSKLDTWLGKHNKEFGEDRSSDGWKAYIYKVLTWDQQTFTSGDKEIGRMESFPMTLSSVPNDDNTSLQQTGAGDGGGIGVASSDGMTVQRTAATLSGGSLFSGSLDSMPAMFG